jgi:hypothetical protein
VKAPAINPKIPFGGFENMSLLCWTILMDVPIMEGPRNGTTEVKPLNHALVDDSIGIPKKSLCFQAGSSTFYKVE